MDYYPLISQLLAGAVGGNLAGSLLKNYAFGAIGNAIAGVAGGVLAGQVLNAVGVPLSTSTLDIGSIVGAVGSGAIGGGVLMLVIRLIQRMFAK